MVGKDKPNEPRNRLRDTSQGKKTDFPPSEWIKAELIRFGALRTGKKWHLDLEGVVHPIFTKSQWRNISHLRYDTLRQSFLLSTRLLQGATNWLSEIFTNSRIEKLKEKEDGHSRQAPKPYYEKGWEKLVIAELAGIAGFVVWREDPDLFEKGHWADNHPLDDGKAYPEESLEHKVPGEWTQDLSVVEEWDWATRRAKKLGYPRRHITISIASQFVDALLETNPKSEEHLKAAFMAAITMTHQVAHAAFNQNLDRRVRRHWVGNEIEAEIGHSLISDLFGGWIPHIHMHQTLKDSPTELFNQPLSWRKWFRGDLMVPLALYQYSLPVSHVQKMFSQDEWSKIEHGKHRVPWDLKQSLQALLHPTTIFGKGFKRGKHARVGRLLRSEDWYSNPNLRGYKKRDHDAWSRHVLPRDEDWDDGSELVVTDESVSGSFKHSFEDNGFLRFQYSVVGLDQKEESKKKVPTKPSASRKNQDDRGDTSKALPPVKMKTPKPKPTKTAKAPKATETPQISTARNTRSKRKLAESHADALDKQTKKRRAGNGKA